MNRISGKGSRFLKKIWKTETGVFGQFVLMTKLIVPIAEEPDRLMMMAGTMPMSVESARFGRLLGFGKVSGTTEKSSGLGRWPWDV